MFSSGDEERGATHLPRLTSSFYTASEATKRDLLRNQTLEICAIDHTLVLSALSVTLAQLEHEHAVSVGRRCDEVTEELQLQQNSTADQMDLMVTKAKLESDVSHLKETQVWPLTQTFNSLLFVHVQRFLSRLGGDQFFI